MATITNYFNTTGQCPQPSVLVLVLYICNYEKTCYMFIIIIKILIVGNNIVTVYSSEYPMITYTHYIANNLPIKTLVARSPSPMHDRPSLTKSYPSSSGYHPPPVKQAPTPWYPATLAANYKPHPPALA